MLTHTPGPWQITKVDNPREMFRYQISDSDGVLTAATIAMADASLVESAPALLLALAGCVEMLKESAKQFRQLDNPGHANMCHAHASLGAETIAKAIGKV